MMTMTEKFPNTPTKYPNRQQFSQSISLKTLKLNSTNYYKHSDTVTTNPNVPQLKYHKIAEIALSNINTHTQKVPNWRKNHKTLNQTCNKTALLTKWSNNSHNPFHLRT